MGFIKFLAGAATAAAVVAAATVDQTCKIASSVACDAAKAATNVTEESAKMIDRKKKMSE